MGKSRVTDVHIDELGGQTAGPHRREYLFVNTSGSSAIRGDLEKVGVTRVSAKPKEPSGRFEIWYIR